MSKLIKKNQTEQERLDAEILGFVPREYQIYYRDRIGAFFKSKEKKALMQSHTGTGKTKTLFLTMLSALKGIRIAFVTPRINLTHQTLDDAKSLGIESEFGLVQGNKKKRPNARVVFWSIQTLRNHMKNPTPKHDMAYDLIVYDECQVELKMQEEINEMLPTSTKILGLTATPYNSDATPLRIYSDAYMVNTKYKEIDYFIKNEFLVDVEYIKAGELIDVSLLNRSRATGDYTEKSLKLASEGTALDICLMAHSIIQKKQLIMGRRMQTLAFAQNIKHANEMTAELQGLGYTAKSLHSDADENQLEILRQFKDREFQVIVTVGMVGFGVDLPEVEIIIYGKKTASHSLFRQEIGRGIRSCVLINKKICVVIDCVNNIDELGHPLDAPVPNDPKEKGKSSSPKCEFCEEPTLSLVGESIDEVEARLVKVFACSSCGEDNIRVSALPSFECSGCNGVIYRQLHYPPVKHKNGDLVCTCPNNHDTTVGRILPKEMFVVFRSRESGIKLLMQMLEERKPSEALTILKGDIVRNKDVMTDRLLSYSVGVAGNLVGNYSEDSLYALANVVRRFEPFIKLELAEEKDNASVRDIILNTVSKKKYTHVVNMINRKLITWREAKGKRTELQATKHLVTWAIKNVDGIAIPKAD